MGNNQYNELARQGLGGGNLDHIERLKALLAEALPYVEAKAWVEDADGFGGTIHKPSANLHDRIQKELKG